jgi:DNA repair/transcription protein MET18/MMS19
VLLIEFDIEGATEDLFDISFCYFPITFTPPPDDPYGISSEELQVALRRVLAANPHFGPLALPLILDKLSASSKSAKVRPKDGAAGGLIPGVGAKP